MADFGCKMNNPPKLGDKERAYMFGSNSNRSTPNSSRLYIPIERENPRPYKPRDYTPYRASYISDDTRALFPEEDPNIYK